MYPGEYGTIIIIIRIHSTPETPSAGNCFFFLGLGKLSNDLRVDRVGVLRTKNNDNHHDDDDHFDDNHDDNHEDNHDDNHDGNHDENHYDDHLDDDHDSDHHDDDDRLNDDDNLDDDDDDDRHDDDDDGDHHNDDDHLDLSGRVDTRACVGKRCVWVETNSIAKTCTPVNMVPLSSSEFIQPGDSLSWV